MNLANLMNIQVKRHSPLQPSRKLSFTQQNQYKLVLGISFTISIPSSALKDYNHYNGLQGLTKTTKIQTNQQINV